MIELTDLQVRSSAIETTRNVVLSFVGSGRKRRSLRRRRRELVSDALVANGVPAWIRAGVWLGRWVSSVLPYVLPYPFNIIVPAVLWCVDQMIEEFEE